MKSKNKPVYVMSVEEIFNYYLMGIEKDFYVSNLISHEIVEFFSQIFSPEIEITVFDHMELWGEGFINLSRNGSVKFKLNKKITIYKQKYYYWSKCRKLYKTTLWN